MTSYYARHGRLHPDTLAAEPMYNDTLEDRVYFYVLYFQDIVPHGVTVHHVWDSRTPTQEIQLKTRSGHIFMSGLVSLVGPLKRATKNMARWYYRHAYYADDDGCWRYFTALEDIETFNGYNDYEDQWHEVVAKCDPIDDVAVQAQSLQVQYDSMRTH